MLIILKLFSNTLKILYSVSVPIRPVNETQKNLPITIALQKIQSNMDILDNVAGRTPQLSRVELITLISTVFLSGLSPFM